VVVQNLGTAIRAFMHKQGQVFGVYLADKVSNPIWATKEPSRPATKTT